MSLSRAFRTLIAWAAIGLVVLPAAPLPPLVLAAAADVGLSAPAEARGGSGGYSRPGGFGGFSSGIGRRPSFGSFGDGSGGYSRPPASSFRSFDADGSRGGDRAISRGLSGQALQDYRSSQQPAAPPMSRRPSTGWDSGAWSTAPIQRRAIPGTGWNGGSYAQGPAASRGFGFWDAALAWTLLSSLSSPRSDAYFRDHRNDPGYAQWRAEADQKAANDPALAQKLAALDATMAKDTGQQSANGTPQPRESGSGLVPVVLFLGVAAFVGLWLLRRRAAHQAAGSRSAAPGLTGSAASRFRIGMTIPFDPSPFLLAANVTKVKPPDAGGGAAGGMLTIEALGLVSDAGVSLHRLYLPGGETFFLLHLGTDGAPDECRYFSPLDEITPASREEWGFWLDPAQGMIGWPQFQTKDGKLYDRAWAPGGSRVPPRRQDETVQDLRGTTRRQLQAMLYGARTSAAPPAPPTEYVLVAAVESGGQAWVEVHAGIDINPAALTLPAVPLSA